MSIKLNPIKRRDPKTGKRVKTGAYQCTIRASIGKHIPANAVFEPELTEDGVLLRFMGVTLVPAGESKPKISWLDDKEVKKDPESGLNIVALTDEEIAAVDRATTSYAAGNGVRA